ncbi:GntR family transcriptional regulator [Aurantimonas sp. MSK8Z-1]|uniref:GntR family transcriptional regulator n=1 Tax=Mangrovibrevibacter kandeliae TaxID=2968473 RepID=UPI002119198E|nr:GntR family transcriptional regulator [Aurantimonas sp. MSK8Z-1]MCW4114234.1 GntR family transcriptional regulator [Aurantimonas sp. MSK8Z-1]
MSATLDALLSPGSFATGTAGPRYLQLKRLIEEAIRSGLVRPGEALPAEREIAARTALSRVTVRRAVQDLVDAGLLFQRHGSGTFVAPRIGRVEQSLSELTSFSEDMAARGIQVRSVWLDRGIYPPSPEEFVALGLFSNERVARVARLRVGNGEPLAIERAALSTTALPDPAAVEGSLYAALATAGMRPVRAIQRISAALLNEKDAGLLGVVPGSASLNIERTSYLSTGKVVEFTRSIYRADAYDFVAELRLSMPSATSTDTPKPSEAPR